MFILNFLKENLLLWVSIFLLIISFSLTAKSFEKNSTLRYFGVNVIGSVTAPVEKGRTEMLQTATAVWNRYIDLWTVVDERDELVKKVNVLRSQFSVLNELRLENERLRALLNFGKVPQYKTIGVTIIGRNISTWVKSFTIDKGREDGIKIGSPVIDGRAVVGQVIGVSSNHATVLLLTDNTSSIDGIIQRTRVYGIIEGTGTRGLAMRYVVNSSDVLEGDVIVSSGLDDIFPKGRLIGTVTKVIDTSDLFKEIEVKPAMDIDRLEELMVLVHENI